jgi:hypothetical protein
VRDDYPRHSGQPPGEHSHRPGIGDVDELRSSLSQPPPEPADTTGGRAGLEAGRIGLNLDAATRELQEWLRHLDSRVEQERLTSAGTQPLDERRNVALYGTVDRRALEEDDHR